jgi:hypothetical protein
MPLTHRLKELEKEITDELKSQKIPVYFEIVGFDAKTRALEHKIGFYNLVSKDVALKVNKIISKHYDNWLKKYFGEILSL